MQYLKDRVAVVTGAASGIGRALADRLAAEGMRVVLADVEEGALDEATRDLADTGATVLGVRTDVSKGREVEALAAKTLDAFGAVHVVCNNAGVIRLNTSWEQSMADWEWILGVNLWGVIHGIRTFVPIMLRQGTEGHIVNTASNLGFSTFPFYGGYAVSKHGVVALSETLHQELAHAGSCVKVSLLCPGLVDTRIYDAERNRPAALVNDPDQEVRRPEVTALEAQVRDYTAALGMSPKEVAARVVDAIRGERFYILAHPGMKEEIRSWMDGILHERNPVLPAGL